jgi:hypothetical protein
MKTKQHTSAQEWNLTQKVQQNTDFANRVLYVGIDVHKVRWQVAVYYEGLVLSNTTIEGSSEALVKHLRKHYGDARFSPSLRKRPLWFFALQESLGSWHGVYGGQPSGHTFCR